MSVFGTSTDNGTPLFTKVTVGATQHDADVVMDNSNPIMYVFNYDPGSTGTTIFVYHENDPTAAADNGIPVLSNTGWTNAATKGSLWFFTSSGTAEARLATTKRS